MTAYTGCDKQGPELVLADYISKWEAGDYSAMYSLLSDSAQTACSEETFITRHRKISQAIGLQSIKLNNVINHNGILVYGLEFTTATVGVFSQEYQLEVTWERDQWRLDWDHCHIFSQLNRARVVRVTRETPPRGAILDANSVPLAYSGTVYEVGVAQDKVTTETVAALAALLKEPVGGLMELLEEHSGSGYVAIAAIEGDAWGGLRPKVTALPGVLARALPRRIYSIPSCLAHTIGYIGQVEEEQLAELASIGYEAGDKVGRCGLELEWERELAGTPGFSIDIRDENDNVLAVVARRSAQPGVDVTTTLNLEKVKALDAALGQRTGCALLLDWARGDIIAVASKPGFDCNAIAQGLSNRQYQDLLALDSPFLNRAFNGLYPPGSIFKPFTALMALAEGVFDPEVAWDTPVHWQGEPDWGGYRVTRVLRPPGPVNLAEAMRWSDNVYFADLGLKVGWPAFSAYAARLGFDQAASFPLCYQQSLLGSGEGGALLADSSYGQGRLLITPLHAALMYAALGRGDGVLPLPRIAAAAGSGFWLETGFSTQDISLVDEVLAYTASATSALSWSDPKVLRGKTGTSEISRDRQIAWYLCYCDGDVLAVALEGDRTLSSVDAVQVARQCLGLDVAGPESLNP